MSQLTVACIQTNSQGDIAGNIAAIRPMVHEAAARGATFIALPENVFYMDVPEAVRPRLSESEHPGVLAAQGWAKEHSVWVLIGSVAVLGPQDDARLYNRSLLISPQGEIAARYDKIHLFDVEVGDGQSYRESARIIPGEQAVTAIITPSPPQGGREIMLGMSVCYDVRFAHLYRAMAKAGATMLAVPAAFTYVTGSAHWHVLLRARAIETGCFVIAPAQCGMHPGGRRTYGHSLIIDPWGEVLAEASEDAPGIILATLNMNEVQKRRGQVPSLLHDRDFT